MSNKTKITSHEDENGKGISRTQINHHDPEKMMYPRMDHWHKEEAVSWKTSSECPDGAAQHFTVDINPRTQRLNIQAVEGYSKRTVQQHLDDILDSDVGQTIKPSKYIDRHVFIDLDKETAIELTKLLQKYIDIE